MVARRHGLSEILLYNWRSAVKAAASTIGPEPIAFVPIGRIDRAGEAHPKLLPAPTKGYQEHRVSQIEIELANGVRVRIDASVEEKALSRVLRALKGAAGSA
jgi:transposase